MPISFPDDIFMDPAYMHTGNFFFPEVWKEGVMEVLPIMPTKLTP